MKITVQNLESKIPEFKEKIKEAGGNISDDTVVIQGVTAKYSVDGNDLNIEIIEKPWLISEGYIEGKIRGYLN